MIFKTVSVIGLGYIGLPTAAMFASKGTRVIGVDVNQNTVDTINRGEIHIVEPELDLIVANVVTNGYLSATKSPEPADAFLIAVPTPFKESDNGFPEANLDFIEAAARGIASVLKKGDLVVLESTAPVGTTEKMSQWLEGERPDLSFPQNAGEEADIKIAYCPERVLPGKIVAEMIKNDRVIGGMSKISSEMARRLYGIFVEGDCVETTARTAEMTKLTENACRDVQIAFANELSIICDKLDIDVWELISLSNRHPRINILQPGPGVGGHCIAVDPWFIVERNPNEARLIHAARIINDSKPSWVLNEIKEQINEFLADNPGTNPDEVTVGCYGLAFKANIDDLRESPAALICESLSSLHSGVVYAVEPNVKNLPRNLSGAKLICFSAAIEKCDIHVLLVDHNEFYTNRPASKYIVDTRGIWS